MREQEGAENEALEPWEAGKEKADERELGLEGVRGEQRTGAAEE